MPPDDVMSDDVVPDDVVPGDRLLAAVWPFVRAQLPDPPAHIVELGCGPQGGFVPAFRAAGFAAIGIDPEAPHGPWYSRLEFEHYDLPEPADVLVACTSLHHVADLGRVLDLAEAGLAADGAVVVIEWARERFDEATARWCFDRMPRPGNDPGWLHKRYAEWRESGRSWDEYFRSWLQAKGLHSGSEILVELRARFGSGSVSYAPYFFPDLAGITEADEQAAIDAGEIQANRVQYVGRRRPVLSPRPQ